MKLLSHLKAPFLVSLVLLVLCGFLYPMLLTGISQVAFPQQANGSMLTVDGVAVGSALVGQDFTDPRFMKCRPSAYRYNTYTAEEKADGTYAGVSSGSNNYAATNPALVARVQADMMLFLSANPTVQQADIPTDLLTASGSGLDPHISPAAAKIQVPALAVATGLTEVQLQEIVDNNTEGKVLGIFGENRVNVLKVNLAIAAQLNPEG